MREIIAGFLVLGIFGGVAFTAELNDRMALPADNNAVTFHHVNHANNVQGNCNICHGDTTEEDPGIRQGVSS